MVTDQAIENFMVEELAKRGRKFDPMALCVHATTALGLESDSPEPDMPQISNRTAQAIWSLLASGRVSFWLGGDVVSREGGPVASGPIGSVDDMISQVQIQSGLTHEGDPRWEAGSDFGSVQALAGAQISYVVASRVVARLIDASVMLGDGEVNKARVILDGLGSDVVAYGVSFYNAHAQNGSKVFHPMILLFAMLPGV